MATFRCKRSGNTVSFTLPQDIEGLRKHEGYEEVIETEPVIESAEVIEPEKRKPGRPKKEH